MKAEAVIVVLTDKEGRFLLGKRDSKKQSAPGYWTPISGTIEQNENQKEAVVREYLEEIGIEVEPVKKVYEMYVSENDCILHWWAAIIVRGTPNIKNDELTELKWVSKEELDTVKPIFKDHLQVLRQL